MAYLDHRIKVHQIWGRTVYNHAKFCGSLTRSVRDIRDRKFVPPKKWAKIHQNRLRPAILKPPPIMPNFIEIGDHLGEKRYKKFFTTFNILAPHGDPLGQRSPVWVVRYTNPPLATCKISSRSDDPMHSEISAAKLRRSCCLRDSQKYTV